MAEYEVMVRVHMSRWVEADSDEEAVRLAGEEARAVAMGAEATELGGAAISDVDSIMRDNVQIDIGELDGLFFSCDGAAARDFW